MYNTHPQRCRTIHTEVVSAVNRNIKKDPKESICHLCQFMRDFAQRSWFTNLRSNSCKNLICLTIVCVVRVIALDSHFQQFSEFIDECIISLNGPVNCHLTPLGYFLWGYVKSLIYADKPDTIDNLKTNMIYGTTAL